MGSRGRFPTFACRVPVTITSRSRMKPARSGPSSSDRNTVTCALCPNRGCRSFGQGRVSVYEPRGEYQIIVEVMEPQGVGALQLAFDQLKKRLDAEGLFDASRKKPLPALPQSIGIVTSPTGAAVRDILKILQRSPYSLTVTILPVRVQGVEGGRRDCRHDPDGRFSRRFLRMGPAHRGTRGGKHRGPLAVQ